MATNSYTKTNWVNGQAPALNAENLNHIEQGIYDATEGVRALEGAVGDLSGKANIAHVQEGSGSAYPSIDTAVKRDTLYLVHASNGGDQGILVFNGNKDFSAGTSVTQVRTDRVGRVQRRTGVTVGDGTVDWSNSTWENFATEAYVDTVLTAIADAIAAI